MRHLRRAGAVLLSLALLALAGCGPEKGAPKYIFGVATVESVRVERVGEPASHVSVVVAGTLRDGCTEIEAIKQSLDGHVFTLTVATRRPLDAVCDPGSVPFSETVTLATPRALRSGEYVVVSGDVTTAFRVLERGIEVPL